MEPTKYAHVKDITRSYFDDPIEWNENESASGALIPAPGSVDGKLTNTLVLTHPVEIELSGVANQKNTQLTCCPIL